MISVVVTKNPSSPRNDVQRQNEFLIPVDENQVDPNDVCWGRDHYFSSLKKCLFT